MSKRTATLAFAGILMFCLTCGKSPNHNRLPGLWQVTSIMNLTAGQPEPLSRQYYMFTESHMMIIIAGEDRPRIQKSLADMSAEEVMSQQPMGAGFYRYTLEGGKIVRTALIALSAYYEGRTVHTDFKLDGNTLTIRDNHSADGSVREWRMTRLES